MSEAKLDITGSTAVAQREVDKLTKANAKLRESIRLMNEESKKGAKDGGAMVEMMTRWQKANSSYEAGMKNINAVRAGQRHSFDMYISKMQESTRVTNQLTGGVIGMAARFAAVAGPAAVAAAGVAIITRELQKFNEQSAEAVHHHKAFQDELSRITSGGKDATSGGRVEEFVKNVKGATKEDALRAFQGVSSEMQTSSFEKRSAVAGSVARLGITGRDVGAQGLGGMAGFLAQDMFPGYKPEDAADVAALLQQMAGGDFEKMGGSDFKRSMQQLVSSGAMTPEQAAGLGVSAATGDVSAKVMTQIAKTAAASKESIGGIGETGKVAAAKRKLGKMSPADRVKAMLSDHSMAEAGIGEAAVDLAKSRLSMEDIESNAALISGVQSRDVIGEQRQGLAGSSAGRGRAARYQTQVTKETAAERQTLRDTMLADIDEAVRSRHAGKGALTFLAGEAAVGTRKLGTLFGGGVDAMFGKQVNPISGKDDASLAVLSAMLDLHRRSLALEEQRAKSKNTDAHIE